MSATPADPADAAAAAVRATASVAVDLPGDRWLALPPAGRPRLLVRAQDVATVRPALRRLLGHGSLARRAAAQLGASGLALGGGALLSSDADWSLVGDRLLWLARRTAGAPDAVAVIRLSLDRPNSKPVLQLFAPGGGDTIAFVKAGWDPLTAALVRAEAATLSELEPRSGMVTPAVLGTTEGDVPALAVTPLPLGSGRRARTDREALADRALTLFPGDGEHVALHALPFVHELGDAARSTAAAPSGGAFTEHVLRALDGVVQRAGELALPVDRWHGDWSTANVRVASDGTAMAWDWERSTRGAPAGLDAAYVLLGAGVPTVRAFLTARTGDPARTSALVALAALARAQRHAEALVTGHRTHGPELLRELDAAVAP